MDNKQFENKIAEIHEKLTDLAKQDETGNSGFIMLAKNNNGSPIVSAGGVQDVFVELMMALLSQENLLKATRDASITVSFLKVLGIIKEGKETKETNEETHNLADLLEELRKDNKNKN